jgi:hypothetical protein
MDGYKGKERRREKGKERWEEGRKEGGWMIVCVYPREEGKELVAEVVRR